jgi:hypothetical protein
MNPPRADYRRARANTQKIGPGGPMPTSSALITIAAVSELDCKRADRRIVHIEIEPGQDQPQGRVDAGDGTWQLFWGWLELMQKIEDAADPRSAPGAQ